MTAKRVYATGAYGRSAKRADWEAGKDFKFVAGPYFSIRDVPQMREMGVEEIEFRGAAGDFVVSIKEPQA
jgi:hypothetical protein